MKNTLTHALLQQAHSNESCLEALGFLHPVHLGSGTAGSVYRVQPKLKLSYVNEPRYYAIKIFDATEGESPKVESAFLRDEEFDCIRHIHQALKENALEG